MSVAENKAILERFWGEIFNEGDVAVVDELVATEYLNHDLVPGETPGSEGPKRFCVVSSQRVPRHPLRH
jgi:hypothetical protein